MLKSLSSLLKKVKTNKFKKLFIFYKAVKKVFLTLYKVFITVLMLIYYNFNLLI